MTRMPGFTRAASAAAQQGLSAEAVVRWAVQCLYQDEANPRGPLLQWFLLYLLGVKLSHKQLRTLITDTPGLRLEPISAKKLNYSAVLDEPPPGFQGFLSEDDVLATLDEDIWAEASSCLGRGGWHKAAEASHKYYVVAAWLQDVSLRFGEMSFGRVLSIVRCSMLQGKGLLGHRESFLVPYAQSEEYERKMNACMGQPTHVAPDERYVKTWEELRQNLRTLLVGQKENSLEVSKVKSMFRTLLKTELSETVFGHQSLSKLLGDPQLCDEFLLEMMQGNRYVLRLRSPDRPGQPVVPAPLALEAALAERLDAGPPRHGTVMTLELATAVNSHADSVRR